MTKEEQLLQPSTTEKWGIFEIVLVGPQDGNPFTDVTLSAEFRHVNEIIHVDGFYDGMGTYRIRFMPETEGEWSYLTHSNVPALNDRTGTFTCIPPGKNSHGPVRTAGCGFEYADGTRYTPFGTTCYAWIHQQVNLQEQTIHTLASTAFNKVRMCIFPKYYAYNLNEPEVFPYICYPAEVKFDMRRFDPRFWRNLESRLVQLRDLNIEADLILFHPYDEGHWGFDNMDEDSDDFYLRYVIARLAAHRNVWWSVANEWDFMVNKTVTDFDRYLQILQRHDPFHHLRSNHNGVKWYDHTKPWVTHASIQNPDPSQSAKLLLQYHKPVIFDECMYEGNIESLWGCLTPEMMTQRFWDGVLHGGYVTHGETYTAPDDILWWSKGGSLHGKSPQRIAFLRTIIDEAPLNLAPNDHLFGWESGAIGVLETAARFYLVYFGPFQPARKDLSLPSNSQFTIEIIDTWNMVITKVPGTFSGKFRIELPGKPYLALRIKAVD